MNVDAAAEEIVRFYANYRSYRWVGNRMVIRINQRLTEPALAQMNEQFADLVETGAITQGSALPEEDNEPELAKYPRLILQPHRRNFGRMRLLLDAVNMAESEQIEEQVA